MLLLDVTVVNIALPPSRETSASPRRAWPRSSTATPPSRTLATPRLVAESRAAKRGRPQVSAGTSHTTALRHAGVDATTATAAGYALSFAVAAGVTAFGAQLGFVGIHLTITATARTLRKKSRQRAA